MRTEVTRRILAPLWTFLCVTLASPSSFAVSPRSFSRNQPHWVNHLIFLRLPET